MNWLDFVVLMSSLLGIAVYGMWHTRKKKDLNSYLKGSGQTPWFSIGLSVMATQASAITFLSTPGQGYLDGLGFIQIYFGMPIALIIISMFFLPIFHKLNVYTAYEYLGKRFDTKTRLFGAVLFLVQRGIGAGLTIYAPAIVLNTVMGWPLDLTIIGFGLLVTMYTLVGGNDAVTVTQKLQLTIILAGMLAATCFAIGKLPAGLTLDDTFKMAGGFHKLNAVNFSTNLDERYTIWSGILGGTFLMLSYFGTDQSQVQRYISGSSIRESRLGLLFNAVCKIPMQLFILLIGVVLFIFYQFNQPPLFFDSVSSHYLAEHGSDAKLLNLKQDFNRAHTLIKQGLENWLTSRHKGDQSSAAVAFAAASSAQAQSEKIRAEAGKELAAKNHNAKVNDVDYVFITFILEELPHGVIGLLIAAFFAAALSSKAAELSALGGSTTIDFYRHLVKRDASDQTYVRATKWFTALWGAVAIGIALYAHLVENLIQAVNILGSVFYGVMLGLFVVAFFIRRVGGTAIFWGALAAQMLVFIFYFKLTVSYLWYPLIGCAACVAFSLILQAFMGKSGLTKEIAS